MELFVEKGAEKYQLSKYIVSKFENSFTLIDSYEAFEWELLPFPQLVSLGKSRVFLMHYKGNFFRKCPGTKVYFCCGYKIFHFAEGCPFDCSYCILQCYFNRPGIKLWANLIEDGLPELKAVLEESKKEKRVLRIGTGEFADSMALESICGVSKLLVKFWKKVDPFAVLELKTKAAISEEYFKSLPSDPRVIFAWSVNPEKIVKEEEKKTSSLEARLRSAELAIKYGFTVAFHFDPMIWYEGAEEDYPKLLEKILTRFPLERIAWISFGSLRYPPELKEVAEQRFSQSKIYAFEFVKGLDGKKRYFIKLRNKLYKAVYEILKEVKDEIAFYFCMEGERSWKEAFLRDIKSSEDVAQILDESAIRLCNQA